MEGIINMYREFFIILIVIVVVFTLDIVTQKYTKDAIDKLSFELSKLKKDLKASELNSDEFLKEYEEIHDHWKPYDDKLSFFVEHNELEKVNTSFTMSKSFIESNELNQAISELDKAIFILEHVGNKYAFNLANIF